MCVIIVCTVDGSYISTQNAGRLPRELTFWRMLYETS
jgi:hypothetical protein